MASINGICKNCGSLIVTDDRDEMCECLFCDCVFPTAEAIEIAKNSTDYTFPNEPQPKRDGVKRYTAVPVFPDPVPAAVKQAETLTPAIKKEKNPYEVSPDDIKAPRKTFWTIIAITVATVLVVAAVFLPIYLVRTGRKNAMSDSVGQVFSEAGYEVNTQATDGYPIGYSITGSSNNVLKIVTSAEEISSEQLIKTYESFAAIRAKEYGYDSSDASKYYGGLSIEIIAGKGIYAIRSDEEPESHTVTSETYSSDNA